MNAALKFLRWALWYHTFGRFSGEVVTVRFKSGSKVRFRCSNWSFEHRSGTEVKSYEFDNTRSMLGTPMRVWFSIPEIESITVRKWRLI